MGQSRAWELCCKTRGRWRPSQVGCMYQHQKKQEPKAENLNGGVVWWATGIAAIFISFAQAGSRLCMICNDVEINPWEILGMAPLVIRFEVGLRDQQNYPECLPQDGPRLEDEVAFVIHKQLSLLLTILINPLSTIPINSVKQKAAATDEYGIESRKRTRLSRRKL